MLVVNFSELVSQVGHRVFFLARLQQRFVNSHMYVKCTITNPTIGIVVTSAQDIQYMTVRIKESEVTVFLPDALGFYYTMKGNLLRIQFGGITY